jgi:mannose-6-phosphate isomerase
VDWKRVKAGDVIYSSAGTVHAIGAGITLVEVQQNVDLTYRLYDYGRPRELHLEAGIAVSDPVPFKADGAIRAVGPGREILVEGGKFVIERWTGAQSRSLALGDQPAWLIPLVGSGTVGAAAWQAGECWMLTGTESISLDPEAIVLIAHSGAEPLHLPA